MLELIRAGRHDSRRPRKPTLLSWRLVRPYHHGTSFSRLRRGSCAHAGAQVLCRYLREGIRVSLLPPSHPRFYSDRLGFIVSTRYILSSRRYALDVLSFFSIVDGLDWISSNGFCFVADLFEIYIVKVLLILYFLDCNFSF